MAGQPVLWEHSAPAERHAGTLACTIDDTLVEPLYNCRVPAAQGERVAHRKERSL
jgi:hypothetical protein